jgi:hypothetical protein
VSLDDGGFGSTREKGRLQMGRSFELGQSSHTAGVNSLEICLQRPRVQRGRGCIKKRANCFTVHSGADKRTVDDVATPVFSLSANSSVLNVGRFVRSSKQRLSYSNNVQRQEDGSCTKNGEG